MVNEQIIGVLMVDRGDTRIATMKPGTLFLFVNPKCADWIKHANPGVAPAFMVKALHMRIWSDN